jgi:hypothetical protein
VPGLAELVAELRGRVATLEVRCPVEGARVLVRDRQVCRGVDHRSLALAGADGAQVECALHEATRLNRSA